MELEVKAAAHAAHGSSTERYATMGGSTMAVPPGAAWLPVSVIHRSFGCGVNFAISMRWARTNLAVAGLDHDACACACWEMKLSGHGVGILHLTAMVANLCRPHW